LFWTVRELRRTVGVGDRLVTNRAVIRLASAITVASTLTVLFGLLLVGEGPGSEATRLAISHHHGLNSRGLPLLGAWAVGLFATVRLYQRPPSD
jgi:hypothetical protein